MKKDTFKAPIKATTSTSSARRARHEPVEHEAEQGNDIAEMEAGKRAAIDDGHERQRAELQARIDKVEIELTAMNMYVSWLQSVTPSAAGKKDGQDVCQLWVYWGDDCYKISRIEGGWEVTKWSDQQVYHIEEMQDGNEHGRLLRCDCQGGEQHGPTCRGGKGCKHAQMIRRIRATVK